MKRKAVIMLCAFLFVFAAVLGACGKKSHVESILKKGELTVLTSCYFPPYEYLNEEGQAVGVDIDLAKAVAGELGVSLKVEVLPFDELLEALEDGKGDMAISAFTVSQDRKELADFSREYASFPPYMLVAADNDAIASSIDLEGKIIAVKSGTPGDYYATDRVTAKDVKRFTSYEEAVTALLEERVDVILADEPLARYIAGENTETLRLIEQRLTEEAYAMAYPKGSDLGETINTVIARLIVRSDLTDMMLLHGMNIEPSQPEETGEPDETGEPAESE